MQKLDECFQQMRAELGADFVAMDVIGSDGMSIASISGRPDRDDAASAARIIMAMRLASKVSDKLGLGSVEDNLVTTDRVYVLSRFIGDNSYVLSLTVTREAILGAARMLMNDYAPQIWDAIPH